MRSRLLFCVLLAALAIPAMGREQTTPVRLALVNVPDDILRPLLPLFEKDTGLKAEIVYTGRDPFSVAREGKADLVVAHYGHEEVELFVRGNYGLWPHTVFANQIVLLGPSSDPAKIRGLSNARDAFRRIAQNKARFIVNDSAGLKYVEDILAIATSEARTWDAYTARNVEGPQAARAADELKGYVLWGLPPYLRQKRQGAFKDLEPMVYADPLFQRVMVSIVTNPEKVRGVNADGARKFEQFLLTPKIQAWVEDFRYPDFPHQAWWSAGRHNSARD